MLLKVAGLFLFQLTLSSGFYSSSDDVIELTPDNFDSLVTKGAELWLVEFYAPWCGHCQSLTPEWKKLAESLKGIAKVGAVNADEHKSLGGRFQVSGFPTIKIFGYNKNSPKDYQGARNADAMMGHAMEQLQQMVRDKASGGKSGGGSSGGRGGGGGSRGSGGQNDVVTLTDSNFKEMVIDSGETWLVEFYAPWCGHCKNLEPHWKAAATEVKEKSEGQVRLGALDATVHQGTASKYGIRGYPTIKIFKSGAKETPLDYDGGRDTSGIVNKAMEFYDEKIEPPSVDELVSPEVFEEKCATHLCIIAFLPDIRDTGKDGRNEYIELITRLGEKYKKQKWGWSWLEALALPDLERVLNVGGAGYPVVVAMNKRKELYALHTGSFSEEGLSSFMGVLTYGRGTKNTYTLPADKIPEVKTRDPWDGEDAPPIEEEDIDLSDFKWDDEL